MMNKTERFAYDWLVTQGYTGIMFQRRSSPDFLTAEGIGFEVKKARNNVITFTSGQWDKLRAHPNIRIVIFDGADSPLAVLDFTQLPKPPSFWNQFKIVMAKSLTKADIIAKNRNIDLSESLHRPEDIMAYLQVSDETFYRWIKSGELKAIKVGGLWRVSRKALDEFLGVV